MNSVAPARRASAAQRRPAAPRGTRPQPRAAEGLHGRPRPVGGQVEHRRRPRPGARASSRAGAPAPRPPSHRRCQTRSRRTAPAARAAARAARARRPRRAPPAPAPGPPIDQPSETMWCISTSSRCSCGRAAAAPRAAAARARSNGRCASPSESRSASAAARSARKPRQVAQGKGQLRLGAVPSGPAGRPPPRSSSAAARAGARSPPAPAPARPRRARPARSRASGDVVEGGLRAPAVEQPEPLLGEGERQSYSSPGPRSQRPDLPALAPARDRPSTQRGQARDGRMRRTAPPAAAPRPSRARTRETTWVASSEWPPRAKKSSSLPTRSRPEHLGEDGRQRLLAVRVRGA